MGAARMGTLVSRRVPHARSFARSAGVRHYREGATFVLNARRSLATMTSSGIVSADRRDAILRLLDTRFENLPEPASPRSSHSSGFVHGKAQLQCPDCLANGKTRVPGCETCGGSGHVVDERRDPYSQSNALHQVKVLPYGVGEAVARARAVDAEIARLEAQTREPFTSAADELAEANRHPYGWEQARKLMYLRFDYRALDVALEQLAKAHPGVSARSEEGISFIDARMPSPIRAPEPPKENEPQPVLVITPEQAAREERDRRIRELAATGDFTAAEIAAQLRCGLRTVYNAVSESLAA